MATKTKATLCMGEKGTRVSLDAVRAVPVPVAEGRYRPVAYGDAIDYLREQATRQLGLEVVDEQYGLSTDGRQLFAVLVLATDSEETGLSLGLRQSYNKTLALALAAGSSVFVCDNLCFAGNSFKVVRRNTTNAWADFRGVVGQQLNEALEHYIAQEQVAETLRGTPVEQVRGYEVIGHAQGVEVLTPTQANVAYREWKQPSHEAFAPRTGWSLYNAFTEALKKGSAGGTMERHAAAHDFFRANLERKVGPTF